MIVGARFDGDDDKELMRTQHDLYGESLYWLFSRPWERYLQAVGIVGIETELLRRVREIDMFDHRVV